MGKFTSLKILAPFFVACYKSSWLPVFTKAYIITKQVWTSSKILKIVGIHTLSFIMFVIKRTPLSFEVKHIKVEILLVFAWLYVVD